MPTPARQRITCKTVLKLVDICAALKIVLTLEKSDAVRHYNTSSVRLAVMLISRVTVIQSVVY